MSRRLRSTTVVRRDRGADPAEHGAWMTGLGRRLRDARLEKGLTLDRTADLVGVSGSLVSQIERGRVQPSLVTLRRLAQSLGVRLASFLGEEPLTGRVVTRNERQRLAWRGTGVRFEFVSPPGTKYLQLAVIELEPGGRTSEEPVAHSHGEECTLVVKGRVRVELGDGTTYLLGAGDAITLDRTTPHVYRNEARSRSTVICAIYPATF